MRETFLKNLYYPWKKNTIKFNFYNTKNNKTFLRNVI